MPIARTLRNAGYPPRIVVLRGVVTLANGSSADLSGNYSSSGGNNLVVKGSDARLLGRVGQGDPRALGDLYDAHARLLAFRLRREGASVEEAEDVLQETFLDVWRSSRAYRGESEVAAWLWGIAYRKYLMLVRGEVRLRHREESAPSTSSSVEDEDLWALSIDADHALSQLDPEVRHAFRAVVVEGLSTAEAAKRLGVPEGTIKSRVHRARSALQKELK